MGLLKPFTLFLAAIAWCWWVVALAGVSSTIKEQATGSRGFARYEWFLVWFEFVALIFTTHCIAKNVKERTRTSCTAFLAIITAISMTQTTVSFAELDGLRTSFTSGLPYAPYGGAVVTSRQLYSARALFAAFLSWSAANTLIILCMGQLEDSEAAPAPKAVAAPAAAEPEPQAAEVSSV